MTMYGEGYLDEIKQKHKICIHTNITGLEFYTPNGRCKLSPIQSQCSLALLYDLYGKYEFTVKPAIDFLYKGDYTKILYTDSKPRVNPEAYQPRMDFITSLGFKKIGAPYINKRTKAEILWFKGDVEKIHNYLFGEKK